MKLYEILRLEGSRKSSWTGIESLAVAENDEAVARWIDAYKHELFSDYTYDDDGNESDEPEFSNEKFDEVMAANGDLDSDQGWEDSYYGVTKYGWNMISSSVSPEDVSSLKSLGIKLVVIA